jgi:hypothetical protein
LTQAHPIVVDKAPWLFIVHDLNPRAMSQGRLQAGAELVAGLHTDHDVLTRLPPGITVSA